LIGDEQENDPDPSMLPAGTNAYIQVLTPTGYDAQSLSISGTVTLQSVEPGRVIGWFSAQMGDAYGRADGSAGTPLSGVFNASPCP
jgi:hypothetical protein